MWDLRVCRGCLVTDEEAILDPLNKTLKMGYQALTGIEMKDDDGYPTYFCLECSVHIKKAWAFRRKAKRAFLFMREIMIIKNEVTVTDIQTINREQTHLTSSSNYWNLKNNAIYNIVNTGDEECSMVEYTPVIDNLVCHNVELIPEITKKIEEEDDDDEPPVEETIDNGEDDNVEDANVENDNDNIPGNIDLEDVFKDLKEQSSSDSEIEEQVEKKDNKPKQRKMTASELQIHKDCKALCNTNITVLSETEQKCLQVVRSKMAPFVAAKFKCALCVIVFDDVFSMMKHVEDHKVPGDHKCVVCKNMFPTKELLDIHKAENHAYEYTCKTCSVTMYTLLDVIQHNEEKHPKVSQSTLAQMNSLKAHFVYKRLSPQQMYATKNNKNACTKCNKYFKNRDDFFKYMSDSKGPKRFYCDICLGCNGSKDSIRNHIIRFHFYHYICKRCSKLFTCRCNAVAHKRKRLCINKDQIKSELQCIYCNEIMRSKDQLIFHRQRIHYSQVYLYECNLCGHSYNALSALYKHQITMHKYISPMDPKLGSPEHACHTCNYQFYTRRAYQKHAVRAYHPEVYNFENFCRACRKIFDSEKEYKTHICSRNSGLAYPRSCDYCDTLLNNEKELKKHHKKLHRNLTSTLSLSNKMKLCDICGVLLVRGSILKHMRSHSSDFLDKYDCNRCDRPTSWPNVYSYVDHVVQTHTRKPYHCTVCHTAFRYMSRCRDHILKIHAPAMLYNCGKCGQRFSHRDFLIDHSKKIHNVKMKKIKQFPRLRKNLYVYPDMKIDVSLVDSEILKTIKVDLYDYLHKKYKELDDPTDNLITEPVFQRSKKTAAPLKRKLQRNAKINKKPKLSVEHTIQNEDSIITTRAVIKRKRVKAKPGSNETNVHVFNDEVGDFQEREGKDMLVYETEATSDFIVNNIDGREVYEYNGEEIEIDDDNGEISEVYYDNREDSDDFESKVDGIEDELILNDELHETESEEVVEETVRQKLELIDIDGEKYVILRGNLYKVELQ